MNGHTGSLRVAFVPVYPQIVQKLWKPALLLLQSNQIGKFGVLLFGGPVQHGHFADHLSQLRSALGADLVNDGHLILPIHDAHANFAGVSYLILMIHDAHANFAGESYLLLLIYDARAKFAGNSFLILLIYDARVNFADDSFLILLIHDDVFKEPVEEYHLPYPPDP